MRKTYLTGAMGCLLVLLTACSSVTRQSGEAAPAGAQPAVSAATGETASTTDSTPATTKTTGKPAATSASATGTATEPADDTTLVPLQTAQGGWFRSPSGNISCEVFYKRSGVTEAYCQTVKPARSVTLASNGSYQTCTGEQCLGDGPEDTITLEYGQATEVGPFHCESATTGVTCTADGKGFRIANSGITSVTA